MTPTAAVADLVEAARGGSPRALARLVSLVEDGAPALREVMARLAPYGGRAHVVGITGPPGSASRRRRPPWSPRTDATGRGSRCWPSTRAPRSAAARCSGTVSRCPQHALDPDVFVRSIASRGQLGGLSAAAPHAVRVLDVAGFDVVLLETVGVGQSEVDVARAADTPVVLLAPEGR